MTTAVVDDRKRLRLPSAEPGEVYIVETNADNSRILLSKVTKANPDECRARVRFEKRRGYTVMVTDGPGITSEDVKRGLEEFP
jgi:hypothetical protein